MRATNYKTEFKPKIEEWDEATAAEACVARLDGTLFLTVGHSFNYEETGDDELNEVAAELTRIVRAVNCHDDLVEALKKASDEIAGFRRLRGGYPEDNHEAACDTISVIEEIVDAALAKAKGDTPDEG